MENKQITSANTNGFFVSMRTREKVGFVFIGIFVIGSLISLFGNSYNQFRDFGLIIGAPVYLILYLAYSFIMSVRWKYVLIGSSVIILTALLFIFLNGSSSNSFLNKFVSPQPQNYLVPQKPK